MPQENRQIVVGHKHDLTEIFGYGELSGSSLGAHMCQKCSGHQPDAPEVARC